MAKFGEGDARWIVQKREDGTNVNAWWAASTPCIHVESDEADACSHHDIWRSKLHCMGLRPGLQAPSSPP